MRRSLYSAILIVMGLLSTALKLDAQVKNPVKWTFSSRLKGPGKYEVSMKASIEKGWHLYSQNTPDGGPIPTSFRFTRNPLIEMIGSVKEVGRLETRHEKLFGVDVHQFSNDVTFIQIVNLKGKVKTNIIGTVEYMVCNDRECLPPATQNFFIELR